jgi:hypothetical protein
MGLEEFIVAISTYFLELGKFSWCRFPGSYKSVIIWPRVTDSADLITFFHCPGPKKQQFHLSYF